MAHNVRSIFVAIVVTSVTLVGSMASAQQNAVWTNVTATATATGNSIQKTSGCAGCADAGGVSQQQIASGTGWSSFLPAARTCS